MPSKKRTRSEPTSAAAVVKRKPDAVEAYARDVVEGRVVACRLVRLACERHLRDLQDGPARGLTWDRDAAEQALGFFSFLRLPLDGELDGRPFKLEPFQAFIVGSLFGWKRPDGYRRFRTGYIEMGKGNGKTPMLAGIGLYGLVADGEAAAEIYSAATTAFQAGVLFRDARRMAEASPLLRKRLDIGLHNLAYPKTDSFFRPISSEHRQQSGPRPHMGLIDEVHEHPNAQIVDKVRAGTKSRRQALILEITNSGYDRESVCWHHHEYSQKLLEGVLENDAWFAFVCHLDPCEAHWKEGKRQPVDGCADCDDWRDEDTWLKANPGLGTIISLKYLQEQALEAQDLPSKRGIVLRLNFCVWTEQETAWLSVDLWSMGNRPIDSKALLGRPCYGALDLASTTDVCAWVLLFPMDDEEYWLLPRFWIPEERAGEREHTDRVPYRLWAAQGFVTITPGDVTDYNRVEADIIEDAERYEITEAAFDDWNATQMALNLQQHGLAMVKFAQNIRNFNEPTKRFESLLREGKIIHGGNPVLNWMASNVAVITDRSGNVRPVKGDHHSPKKVDGIVAAVMALGRAILQPEQTSVYETRGIQTL